MKRRTRLVHLDPPDPATQRPVTTPTVQATTFVIDQALDDAMAEGDYRSQYLYTRMGNPTVRALERKISALHAPAANADARQDTPYDTRYDTVATASGMAAIASTLFALAPPGTEIIADRNLYGVTASLLHGLVRQAGRRVIDVDMSDLSSVQSVLQTASTPPLVYAETLSNPLIVPLNIPALAAEVAEVGGTLCVDNTFANPLVCAPLEHGADVVIESLSKSIAGHSDVHGGSVTTDVARASKVWDAMFHLGGCLDPHAATLCLRGMKTLHVRTQTTVATTHWLVDALRREPGIRRVYYPDASSLPQGLNSAGSVLSMQIEGGDARALRFLRALTIAVPATSLGGVESLASCPFNTSHRTSEAQQAVGLAPGTVRYSVGCEDPDDLLGDIREALRRSE